MQQNQTNLNQFNTPSTPPRHPPPPPATHPPPPPSTLQSQFGTFKELLFEMLIYGLADELC